MEPLNFNLGRRFQKKKSDRHEAPPDRAAMVKKGKAKIDIDKLTPKDWAQVNNPPGTFPPQPLCIHTDDYSQTMVNGTTTQFPNSSQTILRGP